MGALKKRSVAAMIMLLCLTLSVVIGLNRKDVYVNPSVSVETEDKNISQTFNNWTTFGSISESIREALPVTGSNDLDVSHKDGLQGPVKTIFTICLVIFIIKLLSNKR